MFRIFIIIFFLSVDVNSSDLEELVTYDAGTKDHLLFSRRCSSLNFYLHVYVSSFDQKAEDYGYFFNKMAYGFSALDYFENREDYINSDEDRVANINEQIIIENEKYYDKYIDFYISLTKNRLKENDFTDEDNFNEIIPPLILSDYGFCLAFYDFLQEEIDKSPDDLESLREEKIR
tara:strand:+ start:190 stop:717 length:528 start_codon:yes stop_codon:yes gene_type:complete